MSYTYKNADGRELPIPDIQPELIDYLNTVFGMDQYASAGDNDQLHSVHGMRRVVDHLDSLCKSQEN